MKYDLGSFGADHLFDLAALAHITQQRQRRQFRKAPAQPRIDRIEGEFAVVEKHEPAGQEGRYLPGELGADRAAGSGDEHATPRYQLRHPVSVEHRLRSTQKILEGDRLDGAFGIVEVAAKIGEPRETCERYRKSVGALEQPAYQGAGKILRGNNQLLRALAAPIVPRTGTR